MQQREGEKSRLKDAKHDLEARIEPSLVERITDRVRSSVMDLFLQMKNANKGQKDLDIWENINYENGVGPATDYSRDTLGITDAFILTLVGDLGWLVACDIIEDHIEILSRLEQAGTKPFSLKDTSSLVLLGDMDLDESTDDRS